MDGTAKFITPNCVQYERHVAAPVQDVWPAIATPQGLAQWFIPNVQLDPKLGGRFHFMDGWEGTLSRYDTGRGIAFLTNKGGETTFECTPLEKGGSRFTLTDRTPPGFVPPYDIPMDPAAPRATALYQPGGPGTPWVGILVGWHHFADDLVATITGAETQCPALGPIHDYYKESLQARFG